MTKSDLIKAMEDFLDDIPVQVEFGIDHHVPIERVDEHHPEGEIGANKNYLLLILE